MSAQQCLLETTSPRQTPELNQVFPFTIDSVTYSLPGLMTIRGLIMHGTIYAMPESGNPGNYARYSSRTRSPTIRVGFDELGSGDVRENRKGLLLHECIHAMQDNRAATWMRVDTAEAAAFTGQCLFHRACGRTQQRELSGLVAAAWDVADRILQSSSRSVGLNDIQDLLSEIRAHPTYADQFSITGRYDGIQRPPQQPSPPPRGGCSVSTFSSSSWGAQRLSRIIGL